MERIGRMDDGRELVAVTQQDVDEVADAFNRLRDTHAASLNDLLAKLSSIVVNGKEGSRPSHKGIPTMKGGTPPVVDPVRRAAQAKAIPAKAARPAGGGPRSEGGGPRSEVRNPRSEGGHPRVCLTCEKLLPPGSRKTHEGECTRVYQREYARKWYAQHGGKKAVVKTVGQSNRFVAPTVSDAARKIVAMREARELEKDVIEGLTGSAD